MKRKFSVNDSVLFLGTKRSAYGHNCSLDKYIGDIVTIKDVHNIADPPAYTFKESRGYWVSENCFERVCLDLPEFEACGALDELYL